MRQCSVYARYYHARGIASLASKGKAEAFDWAVESHGFDIPFRVVEDGKWG